MMTSNNWNWANMVETEPVETELELNNSRPRVWGPWATVGFGLVIIVVSLFVQVVITIVFVVAGFFTETEPGLNELGFFDWLETINLGLLISLSVIISSVVCIALLIVFIKARRGDTVAGYLGLKAISAKAALVSLAVLVVFLGLEVLANTVFEAPAESDIMVDAYASSVWPALFWIAVIVVGPVFEEVLFRGFLFQGLRYSRIGVIGAVIVTSLVWAVSHLQYGLFQIAWIFVFGIILGIMRYRTGSLWTPMIMHVLNNLAAVIFIALEFGV